MLLLWTERWYDAQRTERRDAGDADVQLYRRFAQPLERDVRTHLEAARLLRFTDRSVGEIAFETGFSDPRYFSRAFKRHTGQAPTAYRDHARGIVD